MAKNNSPVEKLSSRATSASPMSEVGVTGVAQAGGYVFDEFLPELRGIEGRKKLREMADNDATVGALLLAIQMLLSRVKMKVVPADDDIENFYVEFVEKDLEGLEDGIPQLMPEILTCLIYGFQIMELVYFKRTDGMIGTKKMAPRGQETINRWDMDDQGNLRGLWQWPPNGGAEIYIPASKFMHFRTVLNRDNPEGRSILRNAYRSYHFIKNLQMIEAIGIERDLAGLPVMYIPASAMKDKTTANKYLKLVRDAKKNSQTGFVLPSDPWPDADGKPSNAKQYELKLLSVDGASSVDVDRTIKRHQGDAVRSVLADFLILGQGEKGSFALSKSKTDLFIAAIESIANSLADVFNKRYVSNLWLLNGFPDEMKPKIIPGQIAPIDLASLGSFVRDLTDAGIALTDEPTENVLREAGGLPMRQEGDGLDGDDADPKKKPDDEETDEGNDLDDRSNEA